MPNTVFRDTKVGPTAVCGLWTPEEWGDLPWSAASAGVGSSSPDGFLGASARAARGERRSSAAVTGAE